MKKHAFLLIALVAMVAFATPAKAQMSDEAVISYVEDGLASGKSQQALAKELAARGVSKEQAERLKAKYEESHQAKGEAVQQVGSSDRSRSLSSLGTVERSGAQTVNQPASERRQVFGHDVFSTSSLSFAPSENIPTPANYKLGPGDEVIIDIWGTNQTTIRQTISPDGFIKLDVIGLVYLNGMTIKEADAYMRRQLGRIYSVEGDDAQSEIKLTLGAIRTIKVNIMGEVAAPGTYSISSLADVYHALYRAGGFSELGSLRNVALVRNGKKVADIDVYDFIIEGKPADNVNLQDGDMILVPTYESIVGIYGYVKRPMKYEMKKGETLEDLITLAGGFKGDAYTENLNVERRNGREYQVFTVDKADYSSFQLADGDGVNVGTIINRYENRLEIKGAVFRPGFYQLNEEVNTVKKLIAKADGLRGDAFLNRALLHREREDYTLELVQVDLKGILNGTVADIELKKNDVLTISNVNEIMDLGFVTIVGEVANPGMFRFAANTTIEDLILQAGGLLQSASTAKIDVSRRVKNPESLVETDSLSEIFTFDINDKLELEGSEGFVLQPYDQVYVRRSPGYSAQTHVQVEGEVLFPGSYALRHKETRLSDVIKLAGGTSSWAYVKGARLSRSITFEEKLRFRTALGVVDNVGDSINVVKLDQATRYLVGIDLEEALANPGSDADIVLRDGDAIMVPEYINTIRVSGNVLYPNTVSYDPKLTVNDYIDQAGGFGFKAKRNRVYIVYMNGKVAKARNSSRKVVAPGCEIIVPEKRKKEGALEKTLSIATTSASLATMFGTLYNIIK